MILSTKGVKSIHLEKKEIPIKVVEFFLNKKCNEVKGNRKKNSSQTEMVPSRCETPFESSSKNSHDSR